MHMKKGAVVSLILLMAAGCSRMQVLPEGDRKIREVFQARMEKGELFSHTLEWMAKKLSASDEDIIVKDEAKGRIIGRGSNRYYEYFSIFVKRPFSFTMTVDIKDGRYRVTYDNFNVYYDDDSRNRSEMKYRFEYDHIQDRVRGYSRDLNQYLKDALAGDDDKNTGNEKDDEW